MNESRRDRFGSDSEHIRVWRDHPPTVIEIEEVVSLPFVEVPARGEAVTEACLQTKVFKAKRFCVYADDATKLRVAIHFWVYMGGTRQPVDMPAALFADGPATDRTPFVLHCSECGAPTKEAAPKCSYCGAPFTWRLTETAYGQSGLALDFPPLTLGMTLSVKFKNRSDKAIGADCAFIGSSTKEEHL